MQIKTMHKQEKKGNSLLNGTGSLTRFVPATQSKIDFLAKRQMYTMSKDLENDYTFKGRGNPVQSTVDSA